MSITRGASPSNFNGFGFTLPRVDFTKSENQTKDWRQEQDWYDNGQRNECEKYQRGEVEKITGLSCPETNMRLNSRTGEFFEKTRPNVSEDGYDWTEDLDGLLVANNNDKCYINLKMVCCAGGAQTRTLREVYHFIEAQLKYLLTHESNDMYFINILDGDVSYKNRDKFEFLKKLPEFISIKNKCFIGDLYEFQKWWTHNYSSLQ